MTGTEGKRKAKSTVNLVKQLSKGSSVQHVENCPAPGIDKEVDLSSS
jgi:hypothetical protein